MMRSLAVRMTLSVVAVTIMLSGAALFASPAKSSALVTPPLTTMSAACTKPKLLGIFVPWYQYLKLHKDSTGACAVVDFKLLGNGSSISLVLLAIVDDLLRVAGVVAVIYVIYGGIQYATSQGSPDATAKAQSTVLYALIGLVIALVAITLVAYLGKALTS